MVNGPPVEQELTFRPPGVILTPSPKPLPCEPVTCPEQNAIAVNPGRLSRGASGGTFAQIYVVGKKEGLEANGQVTDRIRVDIRRI